MWTCEGACVCGVDMCDMVLMFVGDVCLYRPYARNNELHYAILELDDIQASCAFKAQVLEEWTYR